SRDVLAVVVPHRPRPPLFPYTTLFRSRGCLLHGQESETHTAIGAGAVSGNLRVWLVGRGAGGGASDWRGSRQVPESARGGGRSERGRRCGRASWDDRPRGRR